MPDLNDFENEELSIDELEEIIDSLNAKKKIAEKLLKREQDVDRRRKAAAKKTKFWVPSEPDEDFWYVDEYGVICQSNWVFDDEAHNLRLEHGNVFKTKEEADLACILHRSINFQIKFAFHAGGNGRMQFGSYLLGQEHILKAKPLAYPTVVYMPNEESALACWRYLKNKKWLTAE